MSADLVLILLLRAGIEPNPGPTTRPLRRGGGGQGSWICCVCSSPMAKNTPSVKCNTCNQWCHWRKSSSKLPNCSNLKSTKEYSQNFVCKTCDNNCDNQNPCDTSNSPPPRTSSPSPTPPPPPPQPPTQPNQNPKNFNLKILQFNINGIKGKIDELSDWLLRNEVKLAAIQETKLRPNQTLPSIPQYTPVRKDRTRGNGGGVLFLVHESLLFERLPEVSDDPFIENISIKIDGITITNVYIPPESSCPNTFNPSISPLLNSDNSIILGDFNAHDSLWCSALQDARGTTFAEEINSSNHGVLNNDQPTRLPSNEGGQPTSPDISLASMSLLPYMSWEPKTELGSDHLPLIISCSTTIIPLRSENKVYVNFKKADWQSFTDYTEQRFSTLSPPSNVFKAEKCFRRIIKDASKKFIPQGRIKQIQPELPAEAADLIKQRDNLRADTPDSPQIRDLNRDIEAAIREHKRKKWRDNISKLGSKTDSGKLFKLIKQLNGQPPTKDNEAIKFKGKYVTSARDLANSFNVQYTSIVRHISNKESRIITRTATRFSLASPLVFSPDQTRKAIKSAKASKAIGPDGMSNIHLKHLGDSAINYLTSIFNRSMADGEIPQRWKNSIVVPLLKPGKTPDESSSYRPVSLLCPAIKILEKLFLPTLQENLPIPSFQHGFRANHSTISALNMLNQDITSGFNHKPKPAKRTVLLQLDLSKAFDMVNLDKLLSGLNNSTLPPALKRWLCGYLHGRQARTSFRNKISSSRNVKTGVPQGAVTSPCLFNFYLSQMPTPPNGIKIIQYADDISIYAVGRDIDQLSRDITDFTKLVVSYLEERALEISPTKSTVTLFTPWNREVNLVPPVKIKGVQVKLDRDPKILGVYFSSMHTFSTHVKKTAEKAKKRLNVLKSLAGTDWGQDKETLITTYKATTRSVLEYGSPIWSPIIAKTSWTRLQNVQNSALRLATGSHTMAAIDHLHQECKVLPLREHGQMIAEQYLAACHLHGHPGQGELGRPPERDLKKTFLTYKPRVEGMISINDDKDTLKQAIKNIHTRSVEETVNSYPPNRVLGRPPPEIHKSELSLSRRARTRLSQLRSGFSTLLKSYQHRIDENIEDKCPLCNLTPHDTSHLFCCPANPTSLTTESLWNDPVEAATFLKLDSDQEIDDT